MTSDSHCLQAPDLELHPSGMINNFRCFRAPAARVIDSAHALWLQTSSLMRAKSMPALRIRVEAISGPA